MTVDAQVASEGIGPAGRDLLALVAERDALAARLEAAETALTWYAERKNYAPAGGESAYDAVTARDGYDGYGPGARARAALGEKP